MKDETQPSPKPRNPIGRGFRWVFSRRGRLLTFAWIVTFLVLLYGEENWRGNHAWKNYRQQLEARGERLDLRDYVPPPIPDDQNFAAMPFVKAWFETNDDPGAIRNFFDHDYYGQAATGIATTNIANDWGNRHLLDLVAWQMALEAVRAGTFTNDPRFESDKFDLASRAHAAPAVLAGLQTNEAIFAELRLASQRPYARYPIYWDLDNPAGIDLPHLAKVKAVVKRLQLHASAELALGQSDKAMEDVNLMLNMADTLKDESTLISFLVRISCQQIITHTIWEGLAEHQWSNIQLKELETRFHQINAFDNLKFSLTAERAFGIAIIDTVRKKGFGLFFVLSSLVADTGGGESPAAKFVNFAGIFIPRGWYSLEQKNYCEMFDLLTSGTYDPVQKRAFPSQVATNVQTLEMQWHDRLKAFTRHQLFSTMLLPALSKTVNRTADIQTAINETALACALERYRLAHGKFPEKLDDLTPQFIAVLPHDVITGDPLKYRPTSDGQFILYSVGWNEKDDGGIPGKTLFDEKNGDWVWQYPAK